MEHDHAGPPRTPVARTDRTPEGPIRLKPGALRPADLHGLGGAAGNRAVAAAVQRDAPGAAPATGRWLDGGTVLTTTAASGLRLLALRQEATELQEAGAGDFSLVVEEASARIAALTADGADRPLTASEGSGLTAFSADFAQQRQVAVQAVARAVIAQLKAWLPPFTDEDLFDLREFVHREFVGTKDTERVTQAAKLLADAKSAVGEVETWTGRAARVAGWLGTAKRLADIHAGVEGIAKSVGELSKLATLTRDVGRTVGLLGGTPAGADDVGQVEGALGVVDFVISAGHVPGLDQLWGGYISKVAKACLSALRSLKDVLYTKDRGEGVRLFFEEHRGDAAAPRISDALVHGVDTGRHFPGGQAVLDVMWTLMRAPDAVRALPNGVEDYLLTWREQLGAGVEDEERITTDSSWSNLWNAFGRDSSPNLLPWLRRHRGEVWVKLYGGMPPPG